MLFDKRYISSVKELIDCLQDIQNGFSKNKELWYRGEANSKWQLTPSLYRKKGLNEKQLISKFKQSSTLLINPLPVSQFDWLFIMQHYGVATRLLDWTESPLVALYFIVFSKTHRQSDGRLVILSPLDLNHESNIPEIPSFEDDLLKSYQPTSLVPHITPLDPVAALAPRNSARMQVQQSTFTIHHKLKLPIEEIGNKNHVGIIEIKSKYKLTIQSELKSLGFSRFQIFPELESISEIIGGKL